MPVHNALPHLDAAVRSILDQSFGDFELVILDDGSTDGSGEALRSWAARDTRIRLVRAEERLGPGGSSNRVVAASRGTLVARMDADDIAHPDRLQRQLDALRAHPDATVVAALHNTVDEEGKILRSPDPGRLLASSSFPPFCHGSATFRRAAFERVGGYRGTCDYWEDIDFFLRLAGCGRILVLTDALYSHRISQTSTRLTARTDAIIASYGRMYECLQLHRRGRGYDHLLDAPAPGKAPPAAFVLLGSPTVWAGRSPRLFRRLLKNARLRPDLASARALAWAAWASLSPRSLRLFLRARLRSRTAAACPTRVAVPWVEWPPTEVATTPCNRRSILQRVVREGKKQRSAEGP